MRWTDIPIHFIDFEGSVGSGIVEFGVATLQAGQVVATRTRLCRATGRIRAEDTAVHRLTSSEVAGQPLFTDGFDYFAGLRETGPLAAHFAGTENALLKSVWPYPRSSPDFARPGTDGKVADWGPWIDSGRLLAELFPKTESFQLESVVTALGLQAALDGLAGEHCPAERCFYHAALYDALAGSVVLLNVLQRPELVEATIPWLLQLSVGNTRKRSSMQQDTLF